jgi:phosphate/sulfate permease
MLVIAGMIGAYTALNVGTDDIANNVESAVGAQPAS